MMKTDDLIEQLARGITPVARVPRPWRRAAIWLVGAAVYLGVLAMMMTSSADVSGNNTVWRFLLPQIAAIAVSIEPQGLSLYADRDLLEPVLLNLLRNAREATAGIDDAEIRLLAKLNRRGNPVIEVSDNGPGVPPELATRIFVPFFTTKERGSGVGLALARQVMTAHGGVIRLVDSERPGATFALTF